MRDEDEENFAWPMTGLRLCVIEQVGRCEILFSETKRVSGDLDV